MDIEDIIDIAAEHGENEGLEVEIGDLEVTLRAAFDVLGREISIDDHPPLQNIFESADSEDFDGSIVNAETIIAAAEIHGRESEPDHRAGDLQDALRVVWALLDEHQKSAVLSDTVVKDMIEAAGSTGAALK